MHRTRSKSYYKKKRIDNSEHRPSHAERNTETCRKPLKTSKRTAHRRSPQGRNATMDRDRNRLRIWRKSISPAKKRNIASSQLNPCTAKERKQHKEPQHHNPCYKRLIVGAFIATYATRTPTINTFLIHILNRVKT